jgi:hypothetical protein
VELDVSPVLEFAGDTADPGLDEDRAPYERLSLQRALIHD